MNQKPDNAFAALARDVLPEQTSGRLARLADVNQRIAQRWLSGEIEAPADVVELLERQQEVLKEFHPGGELTRLIVRAQDAGLEYEVVAAYISQAYEFLMQRKIR